MGGNSALVMSPSLYDKLPYDPVKDFAPISQVFIAANLLVVGWKGTKRLGRTILGRNLDEVVRKAPCDMAIIKTKRLNKNIDNILLVSGGYFESRKALLLALPLAREYGAKVEILNVITDEKTLELSRGNAERLRKMCERVKVECEVHTMRSKSLVNTVLEQAAHHDLLVMGAGQEGGLENVLFGNVYDRIIRSVETPVMVIRTARTENVPPQHAMPALHMSGDP
jgi:nucleotide-binding universal stress UspA family protein